MRLILGRLVIHQPRPTGDSKGNSANQVGNADQANNPDTGDRTLSRLVELAKLIE
ncbi:hypothetical protein [Neorhodopirellula lusitana]|uniref:hypothetical protein n=1 Tax=Neorhodopirellula lusitana TaxID=445327 RepID=UPI0024B7E3D0|nr:hypothetical protein [Neorhodopirellula lusitana]